VLAQAAAFSFNTPGQLALSRATCGGRVHSCSRSRGALRLLAQEEGGGGDKGKASLVDQVASKGIWQAGELPSEATEALERVGWIDSQGDQDEAAPEFTREDIAYMVQQAVADETFVDERSKEMFENDTREKLLKELLKKEIRNDFGVELEDLLNPIKVVSLEKKILASEAKLASTSLSPEDRAAAETEIASFKTELAKERRMVMMDGLKLVFRGQALLSIFIGGALAFDKMPFFPDVPIAARAFGFWTMWLFTIPSLRAVKPLGYPQLGITPAQEKKALNLAFVLTPFTTIALPFATKDPGIIFSVNTAVVAACYALYIALGAQDSGAGAEVEIKGLLKYLDYGSGRERGARK